MFAGGRGAANLGRVPSLRQANYSIIPAGKSSANGPKVQKWYKAEISSFTRRGIVTIYTATSEKARETYRAIKDGLFKILSAKKEVNYV